MEDVSEQTLDKVVCELDKIAQEYDRYEFGLPVHSDGCMRDMKNVIFQFTQIKVQEALRAAANNAEIVSCGNPYDPDDNSVCVDENSILNSYSLENIK